MVVVVIMLSAHEPYSSTNIFMHACLSLNDLVGWGGRQHTVGLTVDFHIELETSHLA